MKFLASIDMLCRASLQGRYQSPASHELLNKLEVSRPPPPQWG